MSTASQTDYKDVPPLLTTLTSADAGDLLIIYDISANTTKKITTSAFLTGVTSSSANSTSITGILKGNGTVISAASASDFPILNQNTTGTAANITGLLSSASLPEFTGDVTKPSGSVVLTLPTVNNNVGAFNGITVNAKGQVTAAQSMSYLTNITGLVALSGTNITVTGFGTSASPFVINAATGGAGLSSAYTGITDGANAAAATNGESIRFRSADNKLTVTVGSNDPTYGDNVLLTINEANLTTKANIASPTFTGTVTLPAGTVVNGVTLTTAGSSTSFLNASGTYTAISGGGGGTVTGVSILSANGFAGSTTTGATPQITLTTTVTGLLKGNGTSLSAAIAGTDYASATHTHSATDITSGTLNSARIATGTAIEGYIPKIVSGIVTWSPDATSGGATADGNNYTSGISFSIPSNGPSYRRLTLTRAGLGDLSADFALNNSDIVTALGYTPYNSSNPNAYISNINSSQVTTALGYTPYNSSNPNGYINSVTSSQITSALGYTPYNGTTVTAQRLLGRGAGSTGAVQEITLGTGLSLSGTTLNAAVSSGSVNLINLADYAISGIESTNGINTWLGLLRNSGKIGWVPAGDWITNGGHLIPQGAIIMGAGQRVSRFKINTDVSGATLFKIYNENLNAYAQYANIEFSGIRFDAGLKSFAVAGNNTTPNSNITLVYLTGRADISNTYATQHAGEAGVNTTAAILGAIPMFNINFHNCWFEQGLYGVNYDYTYNGYRTDLEIENMNFTNCIFNLCGTSYRCNSVNNSVIFNNCFHYLPSGQALPIAYDIQYCGKLTISDGLVTGNQSLPGGVYTPTDNSTVLRITGEVVKLTYKANQDEKVEYAFKKEGSAYYASKVTFEDNTIQSKINFACGMHFYSSRNHYVSLQDVAGSSPNNDNIIFRDSGTGAAIVYSDHDYFENRLNNQTILDSQHIASKFTVNSYFAERNDMPRLAGDGIPYKKQTSYFEVALNTNAYYNGSRTISNNTYSTSALNTTRPAIVAQSVIPSQPMLELAEDNGTRFGWLFYRDSAISGWLFVEGSQRSSGVQSFGVDFRTGLRTITPLSTDNSTNVATTAWVTAKIAGLSGGGGTTSGVDLTSDQSIAGVKTFTGSSLQVRNNFGVQFRIGGTGGTDNDSYTIGRNAVSGAFQIKGYQTSPNIYYQKTEVHTRLYTKVGNTATPTLARVGGVIADFYTDTPTTSGIITNLYTTALPAYTFDIPGDKVVATYSGICDGSVQDRALYISFNGSLILNLSAMSDWTNMHWCAIITIIRDGDSTVRATATLMLNLANPGTTDRGYSYSKYLALSGITFANSINLQLRGDSENPNGLIAKMGTVEWKPTAA